MIAPLRNSRVESRASRAGAAEARATALWPHLEAHNVGDRFLLSNGAGLRGGGKARGEQREEQQPSLPHKDKGRHGT